MILCLCESVSDRQVREAIEEGSRTVKDVGQRCGAGTDCGSCCSAIKRMLEQASTSRPAHQTSAAAK